MLRSKVKHLITAGLYHVHAYTGKRNEEQTKVILYALPECSGKHTPTARLSPVVKPVAPHASPIYSRAKASQAGSLDQINSGQNKAIDSQVGTPRYRRKTIFKPHIVKNTTIYCDTNGTRSIAI